MKCFDTLGRKAQGGECLFGDGAFCRGDFRGADAHGVGGQIEMVEAFGQSKQCAIAVATHIGDNRAHDLIDVLGAVALGIQQPREGSFEIVLRVVKPEHVASSH